MDSRDFHYDPDNDEDADWDPRATCDHTDEVELDVCTGRFECSCGHTWYATAQEIDAELDRQARYHEWAERESRRQWWRDQIDRLAFWRRWRKPAPVNDDDIPF